MVNRCEPGMNDEEMLLYESLRGRHPLADLDVAQGTVGDFRAVQSLRSRIGERRWGAETIFES